jgi:flagellar hook-length control protein FliK
MPHAVAIQSGIMSLPDMSSGTSGGLPTGGSFENYLRNALETSDPELGAPAENPKPSRYSKYGKTSQGTNAGPSSAVLPNSQIQNSTNGSVGGTGLSWLAQMMPDMLAKQGSQPPTSYLQASSQSEEANRAAQGTKSVSSSEQGSDWSEISGGPKPASYTAAQNAGAQSHESPAEHALEPGAGSATQATSSGEASLPLGDAGHTASTQLNLNMKEAFASLERASLPAISGSALEASSAMSGASQNAQITAVKGSPHPAGNATAAAKSVLSKPESAGDPQTTGKDAGSGASSGGGSGAPGAATADSLNAAKSSNESSGDDSKNASSQDNSGKSSASSQANAPSNTAGANASATGLASQAQANSFPAALSQAVQTAASGASAGRAQGAPQSGDSGQASGGDKIATAMDTVTTGPGAAVSAASLAQNQGRAEMRVALDTDSMGAVQLHAVLDSGQIGASIAVVSHEAHTLLNNDLPALQQALADQNVRLDHLTVVNAPMSSGAGAGNGWNFKSGDFNQPRNQAASWQPSPAVAAAATSASSEPATESVRGRLSVRA